MDDLSFSELSSAFVLALSASIGVTAGLLLKFGTSAARELVRIVFEGRIEEKNVARRYLIDEGLKIAIEWAEKVNLIAVSEARGNPFKEYQNISPDTEVALSAILRVDRRLGVSFSQEVREINRVMNGLAYGEGAPTVSEEQHHILGYNLDRLIGELEFWLMRMTRNPTMSGFRLSWHRAVSRSRFRR